MAPTPPSYSWVCIPDQSRKQQLYFYQKKLIKTFFWATVTKLLQSAGGTDRTTATQKLNVSYTTKKLNNNQIIIKIQIGNIFPLINLTQLHYALAQEKQSDIRIFDLVLEKCSCVSAKQFQFGQSLGSVNKAGSFRGECNLWWSYSIARESLTTWNVFISTQLSFCEANTKVSTLFYTYKTNAC